MTIVYIIFPVFLWTKLLIKLEYDWDFALQ